MQGKKVHMQQKTKLDKKKGLKLNLCEWTLREKSENSRKVIFREMMCFKVMKLIYNKTTYAKSLNI